MSNIQLPKWAKEYNQPKRYKVAYGGRGSAKSWTFARMILLKAAQTKQRILCARELQVSIKDSVHKLLCDQIESMGLGSYYEYGESFIRSKSGSEFIFKGLRHNAQEIKSMENITICWTEEAQSISQKSWDLLIPTIRADGSEIWVTFNPDLENDPTYSKFILNPPENSIVKKINYTENPFLSQELKDEMEADRQRDYNRYLHIWEGECRNNTDAAIFKNYEVREFETPERAQFLFGADWGFAQDPNTLNRLFVDTTAKIIYIDYEANSKGVEIEKTPALWDTIPESRRYIVRADSARPELINYMNRHGFQVRAAEKWQGSIEDGIETLRNYQIVIHPRCVNTAKEFALYSYETHKLTGDVLPKIKDANNHHIDAIRYAIEPITKNSLSVWNHII